MIDDCKQWNCAHNFKIVLRKRSGGRFNGVNKKCWLKIVGTKVELWYIYVKYLYEYYLWTYEINTYSTSSSWKVDEDLKR